jgi:HD-GYP domain-containing protein (c-di-GMP phosphodiesterase class II)
MKRWPASPVTDRDAEHPDPARQRAAALVSLALALERPGDDRRRHCERVAERARRLADALGVEKLKVTRIALAGLLQNIGYVEVPPAILTSPAPLSRDQLEQLTPHPLSGASMARRAELHDVAAWIAAHHERPDGRGYPRGLTLDEIPLEARILAVADAYEAMRDARPYRSALPAWRARRELVENAGGQFDGAVVDALMGTARRRFAAES